MGRPYVPKKRTINKAHTVQSKARHKIIQQKGQFMTKRDNMLQRKDEKTINKPDNKIGYFLQKLSVYEKNTP